MSSFRMKNTFYVSSPRIEYKIVEKHSKPELPTLKTTISQDIYTFLPDYFRDVIIESGKESGKESEKEEEVIVYDREDGKWKLVKISEKYKYNNK